MGKHGPVFRAATRAKTKNDCCGNRRSSHFCSILALGLLHIHLHSIAHETGKLWVQLVKVGAKARVIIVKMGESDQLFQIRHPEILDVFAP